LTLVSITALWWSPFVTLGLIAVTLTIVVADARAARNPTVVVHLPRELVRGRDAPFSVLVTAAPATTVRCRQPQTAEVRFSPAEADGALSGTVTASTRGRHHIPAPVTQTRGPLGMATRTRSHGGVRTVDVHADLPGARR